MSSDKIMKNLLLEKNNDYNEEKTNEIIAEIDLSLKKNFLAGTSFKSEEILKLRLSFMFLIESTQSLIIMKEWNKCEHLLQKCRLLLEKFFLRLENKTKNAWLNLKISIFCNLAFLYKKAKKIGQALHVLNPLIKEKIIEEETNLNNLDLNLLGLENLYLLYGELLYLNNEHEQALYFIEKAFHFLKKILENYETLHRTSISFIGGKNPKIEFMKYLNSKKSMMGTAFYLKGKTLEKSMKISSALENYEISYKIFDEVLGPDDKNTIKSLHKFNKIKKNLDFLKSLSEPIKFNPKEMQMNEQFLSSNQELFSQKPQKSTKTKVKLKLDLKKATHRKNFTNPNFIEDNFGVSKNEEVQMKDRMAKLVLNSERKEPTRSFSNPMLFSFSFLTDRRKGSLQPLMEYLQFKNKEKTPQNLARIFRIKTDSQGMHEYYSQKSFLKKSEWKKFGTSKIKTSSIYTPTAYSTSARGQAPLNETMISSIKKMKFDFMTIKRPNSSVNLSSKKKTPREENNSTNRSNKNKHKSYAFVDNKKSIQLNQQQLIRKSYNKDRISTVNNFLQTKASSNYDGIMELKPNTSKISQNKEISISVIQEPAINTFKELEDSKTMSFAIDEKELEYIKRNRFVILIQNHVRNFLERKQKEKAEKAEKLNVVNENEKLKKMPEMNTKISKEYSIYEDPTLGSFTIIEDDIDEKGKQQTKIFQTFKFSQLLPFVIQWNDKGSCIHFLQLKNLMLMFHQKKKYIILDFYFILNQKFASLRLKIYSFRDFEQLICQKNNYVLLNTFMQIWLEEQNYISDFETSKAKKREFLIRFNRQLLKDDDLNDFMEFSFNFASIFSFCFISTKKIVGTNCEKHDISEIERTKENYYKLRLFQAKKREEIKKVVCNVQLMKSQLYSYLGYEKKIENFDASQEFAKFYKNFQIPLNKALFLKRNKLLKFTSFKDMKKNENSSIKFNRDLQLNKNHSKMNSFETVLKLLEEKNQQLSHIYDNKKSSSGSGSLKPEINQKTSIESLKHLNSFKDIKIEGLTEMNNFDLINSNLINVAKSPENKRISLLISTSNSIEHKKIPIPVVKRKNASRKKLFIEKKPHQIFSDKPYKIEEESGESMEIIPKITFFNKNILLHIIKKISNDYFLIICRMDLQNEEIDDFKLSFDTIILKAKKEMKKDKPKIFSFDSIKKWFYEIDRYLMNKISFFLNHGFRFAEKMFLIKNIDLLLFDQSINYSTNKNRQFRQTFLHRSKKKNEINFLSLFSLPSIEKIALIALKKSSLNNSNYFYSNSPFGISYWRFNFLDHIDGKVVLISLYSPLLQVMNYCIIKDRYLQEKLGYLLKKIQISSSYMKFNLLTQNIYEKIDWIGKRLVFCEKRKQFDQIKQRNITALNYQELKFSILFKNMDIYIKTYFKKKKFYEAIYIKGIGKAYLKLIYFTAKNIVRTQNINSFLKFEIIPQNKKNKLFKFMISDCDFQYYFNKKIEFNNPREFLIFINKNIINTVELFKTSLYSKLKIPCYNDRIFSLENILKPFQYEDKNLSKLLEKKCDIYQIIHQIICKIENNFVIITVKRNRLLENFQICLYFQSSCRYFSANISKNDFSKLENNYISKIFPYEFTSIPKRKYSNYKVFKEELTHSINKENIESSVNLIDIMGDNKSNSINFLFYEKFLWERIIKNSQMIFTAKNKMILMIDVCRLVLREELSNLNILHNGRNILLEMTLAHKKKVKMPFLNYKKIAYIKSKNYKILIKIFNLYTSETHSQTLSVRELFFSRIKREKIRNKVQTLEIKQCQLKELAFYWSNIFEKIIVFPKNPEDLYSFDKNYFIGDKNIKKNKIHINEKFKYNYEFSKSNNENFLIYKVVLTVNPRQTVSILYNPKENIFWCLSFIHSKCVQIKKRIKYNEFASLVPQLKYLLELGDFQKIGERFTMNIKNILIIKMNLMLNDLSIR